MNTPTALTILTASALAIGAGASIAAFTSSTAHEHQLLAVSDDHVEEDTEYQTPEQPGLGVHNEAPDIELLDAQGNTVHLADLYAEGPVVLTFYRGGWCPYCTRALSAWAKKLPELTAAGGTLVALTPQKPELVDETKSEHELEYVVLSDAEGEAGRAFMVQFSLDKKTIEKYKGYGIDLTEHNAEGEWTLPAPATFVIDTDGIIRWVWADWDYSQRADPDDVIKAVEKIAG